MKAESGQGFRTGKPDRRAKTASGYSKKIRTQRIRMEEDEGS